MSELKIAIQALLEEFRELEALGEKLQVDGADPSDDQLRVLRDKYDDWYTQSLAILSAELAERFRKEYEGSWTASKIKKFLENPMAKNFLFAEETAPLVDPWLYPYPSSFAAPLRAQRLLLMEALNQEGDEGEGASSIQLIESMMRNLPLFIQQLSRRQRGRPAFQIALGDEYDLQDLTLSLLRLFFEDIRPEEMTASYAGGSTRMDYLLKPEQTVIEMKYVRANQSARDVGDQLIVDIAHYALHADCKVLICVVYDPLKRIQNPVGFERDLARESNPVVVVVVIS